MSEKYELSELEELIRETLERGGEFTLRTNGTSMYPMLVDGESRVVLVKPPLKLKRDDIAFYKRDNGQFVLHRVVGTRKDGYVIRGDNQSITEYGVGHDAVIGVVKAYYKGDKLIQADDTEYLEYVTRIKRKYPIRRLKYLFYTLRTKLFKKR